MKKFLLLVAIATLSSVAYGQLTYVGEVPYSPYGNPFCGKSWKVLTSAGLLYGSTGYVDYIQNLGDDSYIRIVHGDTIDYYDVDNGLSLVRRLIVPGNPSYLSCIIELPRGLYMKDNKDYMLIGRVLKDSTGHWSSDFSVYERNDTSLTLVQTIINESAQNILIVSKGSDVYLALNFNTILYKFFGTVSSNVSEAKADKNGLAAYPNPSHDKITLAYKTTTTATSIRICDVNGRLVERIPVNSNSGEYTLNVSNYPEGVYFYEINGKSSSFMVK